MSIIDQEGNPVAYGWNDIAADEMSQKNPGLQLISDEEFERRFPEVFCVSATRFGEAQDPG